MQSAQGCIKELSTQERDEKVSFFHRRTSDPVAMLPEREVIGKLLDLVQSEDDIIGRPALVRWWAIDRDTLVEVPKVDHGLTRKLE
jgi:hypothetical protein